MRNFVIRTVKDGRVKIGNTYFYPENKYEEYDGRLEGMRFAFGLYAKVYGLSFGGGKPPVSYRGEEYEPVITLWGTEEEFEQKNVAVSPPYAVNGRLPWMWWFAEHADADDMEGMEVGG